MTEAYSPAELKVANAEPKPRRRKRLSNRWKIFSRIVLPASFPGIRLSISIAVTMELTATSEGIAWMALTAAEFLATNLVIVAVLIMAVIGFGLDRIFWFLETRIVHWSRKE